MYTLNVTYFLNLSTFGCVLGFYELKIRYKYVEFFTGLVNYISLYDMTFNSHCSHRLPMPAPVQDSVYHFIWEELHFIGDRNAVQTVEVNKQTTAVVFTKEVLEIVGLFIPLH